MTGSLLQVRRLWKLFPGVQALADVDLDVSAGRVHALMGENGAGKSTLARILAGLDRPDEGEIVLRGRAVRLRHPHAALRAGIAMIHQELLPVPEMTVAENILLGQEPPGRWPGTVDRARMNERAAELLGRLGVHLPPTTPMRRLSVAQMQTVEIAKALAHEARVILMDEPTSALSAHETEALFGVIGELTSRGVAIVYVSHKLDEVFRIADEVTVLRDGHRVATRPIGELDAAELIALMVGRALGSTPPRVPAAKGEVALAVCGLGRAGQFRDVSFTVRCGEILGIAGLMGAGRSELLGALFGLAPAHEGEIAVAGEAIRIRSPREAMAAGIAMVSEDRKRLGLVMQMSVEHNLTLADLRRCCRGPVIDPASEARLAEAQIERFGVRARHRRQRVQTLSGGNQQKVVLAKALLSEPAVLLLDEPTRGIDVAAKAEVHAIIDRLAAEGRAVVLVSSELEEVLALSDRLLVMRHGRVTAELDAKQASQEEVMKYAMVD